MTKYIFFVWLLKLECLLARSHAWHLAKLTPGFPCRWKNLATPRFILDNIFYKPLNHGAQSPAVGQTLFGGALALCQVSS